MEIVLGMPKLSFPHLIRTSVAYIRNERYERIESTYAVLLTRPGMSDQLIDVWGCWMHGTA